jgi:hypothetical protein
MPRVAGKLRDSLPSAAPTGIGSLPHRDPAKAAAFTLTTLPELPAVPSLPRRSPAEGMIAQAAVGIPGITIGQYGSLAVDPQRADPKAPVETDLDHGGYEGMKAFLDAADPARTSVVKWQIVGPVTLGLTLVRAGVRARAAFDLATRAVQSHIDAIHQRIAAALPNATQLVFLDEPMLTDLQTAEFPLKPDRAIDHVSGVLAMIESFGVSGVHCCGHGDWASILASGPDVLSLPAEPALVDVAGYLAEFLDNGGWIAWGVIPTDRPIPMSLERPWREVRAVWCSLVSHGCDPARLLQQALMTPACGLFNHAEGVTNRVFRLLRGISDRVRDEATAKRLAAGLP